MEKPRGFAFILAHIVSLTYIEARNDDQFNFRETVSNPMGAGFDYGPNDWNLVTCDKLGSCLGFPNTWEGSIGWTPDTNICQSCPAENDLCSLHRQSPIDLKRDRAIAGSEFEKTCPDWHSMNYEDGACTWEDLVDNKKGASDKNNFFIRRHALQYTMPLTKDGKLACYTNENLRKYPRLDYSKGFPDWFHLSHTEIVVPSVHTQEGKRYDAEVHLAHFYEVDDIKKNKIGKVSLFLQGIEGNSHWEFLDKLICQWRETEDMIRKECDLPSVPDYIGCRNPLRGRTASPTASTSPTANPTSAANLTVMSVSPTGVNGTLAPVSINYTPVRSPASNVTLTPQMNASLVQAPLSPLGSPTLNGTLVPILNTSSYVTLSPWIDLGSPSGYLANLSHHSVFPSLADDSSSSPSSLPIVESSSVASAFPSDRSSQYPTALPSDIPSLFPSFLPSVTLSMFPSTSPSFPPSYSICDSDIRFERICKDGGCCDSIRSATNLCVNFYDFFGEQDYKDACLHCCEEPMIAGDPAPVHPVYERINCSAVENPNRICKETSCCEELRSTTNYCEDVYRTYPGDLIGSICWYCCSESKEVGPPLTRNLRLRPSSRSLPLLQLDNRHFSEKEIPSILREEEQDDDFDEDNPFVNSAHADERMGYLVVDDSNRQPFHREGFDDEYDYMEAKMDNFLLQEALDEKQRLERRLVNYDHVPFNSYEWMLAVKTEYYFRYEGTFTTPPCSEVVHWRIMKDPIKVNPEQIKELERLLAWRVAPKGSKFNQCKRDTAGRDRPGREGDAVDLNRAIQSTKPLHRMVFCECQDWPPSIYQDRKWCSRGTRTRFYNAPYGFSALNTTPMNVTVLENGTAVNDTIPAHNTYF